MAHSTTALKAGCFFMKLTLGPSSFVIGIQTLQKVSTGAYGFKFLGIIALVISILTFILFIVDCFTASDAEDVFVAENFYCGLPLYLLMASLGFFALVVTRQGEGKSLPGIAYKEYELSSYSKWLQNQVNDTYYWDKYYKPRLVKYHVCSDMVSMSTRDSLDTFHSRELNSFEWGCCKPPEECKMNYTSPTNWTRPEKYNNTNRDCNIWENDPTKFCFDCQSCKAAFAQDVKRHWHSAGDVAIVLVVTLVVLILGSCLIMCCMDS